MYTQYFFVFVGPYKSIFQLVNSTKRELKLCVKMFSQKNDYIQKYFVIRYKKKHQVFILINFNQNSRYNYNLFRTSHFIFQE